MSLFLDFTFVVSGLYRRPFYLDDKSFPLVYVNPTTRL